MDSDMEKRTEPKRVIPYAEVENLTFDAIKTCV